MRIIIPKKRAISGTQTLAEGKSETARFRLEEAGVQNYEPTNRNGIQGQVSGQVSTT